MTKYKIKVCQGKACSGNMSRYTLERAQNESESSPEDFVVETCPCQDNCDFGPTVVIEDIKANTEKKYSHMTAVEMGKFFRTHHKDS